MDRIFPVTYIVGSLATTVYLTFFDGYIYTWWNWLFAFSINLFLGAIWPIYWGILHWVM